MRQILIEINITGLIIPIYSYGLMLVVGFLAALFVASRRAKRWNVSTNTLSDLGLLIMISGILGSRLFFAMLYPAEYSFQVFNVFDGGISPYGILVGVLIACLIGWFNRARLRRVRSKWPALAVIGGLMILLTGRAFHLIAHRTEYDWKLFEIWHGGHVYYGAIIAAVVVSLIYLRIHKIPALMMSELAAPSIAIGLVFGRIGCFLSGCCYGKIAEGVPWAVRFPRVMGWVEGRGGEIIERPVGSFAYMSHLASNLVSPCDTHSLPVHPTQLYESLAALVIFLISLLYSARIMKREGETAFLLLVLYCPWRFLTEFYRADVSVASGIGLPDLSISQVMSIPVFIGALVALIVLRRSSRSPS